jgi:hypothetical protein
MGEIDYHRALEMMELSAQAMEHLKKAEQKEQAEKAFQQTLDKLWKSNEKPS